MTEERNKYLKYVLGLIIFALIYHFSVIQADGYYYLDGGARIFEIMSLPDRDVFSFNTGLTYWRIIEWLPNIIFYSIYSLGGEKVLLVLIPAIFSFIFYYFWAFNKRNSFSIPAVFIYSLLVILFYYPLFVIRAEILMCLYFFLFYYFFILKPFNLGKSLIGAFFIQVFWVNSHPSFILSIIFALICCFACALEFMLEKKQDSLNGIKRFSALSGVLLGASFVNPYLHLSFKDFYYRVFSFAYRGVDITQGLGFNSINEHLIWLLLIVFSIIFVRRSKKLPLDIRLIIFATFFMTIYGVRYLILFLIAASPVFLVEIERIVKIVRRENYPKPFAIALSVFIIVFSIYFIFTPRHYQNLYSSVDPCVEFLANKKEGGNIFNQYEYGTYFIHKLYPKYRVFTDGRSYLYDPNLVYLDFRKIAYGNDSEREKLLNCYPVDYVIWPQSSPKLFLYLQKSQSWVKTFSHGDFAVFRRYEKDIN